MIKELCQSCPMRDERYELSNAADKREIRELKLGIETTKDFITWLFDESEHCDHISYQEAWDEFQAWDEKQNSDKNDEPSVATEAK